MMIACLRIVSLALVLMAGGACRADTGGTAAIADLLHGLFDKPGVTLTISPVVVSGDHAIADWAQGDTGGRALLRRKQGVWAVTLCAGDAIKSIQALRTAGVPEPDAIKLAQDLAAANPGSRRNEWRCSLASKDL